MLYFKSFTLALFTPASLANMPGWEFDILAQAYSEQDCRGGSEVDDVQRLNGGMSKNPRRDPFS